MSPELTACTGFDTLTHVLEAFVSRKSNPVTNLYCLKAIALVAKYLPLAYQKQDNTKARYNMALADTYAGWAITAASAALPHAMSHPVSGHYPNIYHGVALAAISVAAMEFNIENGNQETIQKYCEIAKAMGKQVKEYTKREAKKSIEAVKQLCDKIDLKVSLGQLGVDRNKIPEMVKGIFRTMRRGAENNPVSVTQNDVREIYEKSL